jgi:hypothetical protein
MKSEGDNSLPAKSSSCTVKTIPSSLHALLWLCLAAWVISFFLPAAKIDPAGKPAVGWAIALDALVLMVVPVKGAWLGFFPSLWTVFLNIFMLLVPLEIKAVREGRGRVFTALFTAATSIPVVMAYFPPSLGALGLGFPLLLGFYLWELSMIVTAALFVRTLWGGGWNYLLSASLAFLLFCLPIHRDEWNFVPEHPDRAVSVRATRAEIETAESVQPSTIVVESSPNPSLSGEEVTFSARVSVPWGKPASGVVVLTDFTDRKVILKVHTANGTANFSTSELSIGEHAIRATFEPDSRELIGSEQNFAQTVDRAPNKKTRQP